MQSDCELHIFTFRSENWIGFLMNSKSDGSISGMIIRWPKSSEFGPKSDDSAHRILSKNSIGLQPSENIAEQSLLLQQQYAVHTDVRVAIDASENEYNRDA